VLDWPFVAKISWPHGQTITTAQAVAALGQLRFDISGGTLAADIVKAQPAVVQVWFEPNSQGAATAGGTPSPISSVHGTATLDTKGVSWQTSDAAGNLTKAFATSGGRLLVRLHTGLLLDTNRRACSAALDALVGAPQPHVPGGAFEGWMFVQAG
jgi:hypothetical protein